MSVPKKSCSNCLHSSRCQWLLGESYNPDGPCDWDPSRWELDSATICQDCGFKYGHALGCPYVAEKKRRMRERYDQLEKDRIVYQHPKRRRPTSETNEKLLVCGACESQDLRDEYVIRKYMHPTGQSFHYVLRMQRCQRCHEVADWRNENPEIFNAIRDAINKYVTEQIRIGAVNSDEYPICPHCGVVQKDELFAVDKELVLKDTVPHFCSACHKEFFVRYRDASSYTTMRSLSDE